MMIREFVDRTGFEPTATEYAAIEEKYYSFDGSKDEFCKAWVKDGGIQRLTRQRAEKLQIWKNRFWKSAEFGKSK